MVMALDIGLGLVGNLVHIGSTKSLEPEKAHLFNLAQQLFVLSSLPFQGLLPKMVPSINKISQKATILKLFFFFFLFSL